MHLLPSICYSFYSLWNPYFWGVTVWTAEVLHSCSPLQLRIAQGWGAGGGVCVSRNHLLAFPGKFLQWPKSAGRLILCASLHRHLTLCCLKCGRGGWISSSHLGAWGSLQAGRQRKLGSMMTMEPPYQSRIAYRWTSFDDTNKSAL